MSIQLPADWESRPWRMLDDYEVGPQFVGCPLLYGIEWRSASLMGWSKGLRGTDAAGEYRTRYTRVELRVARGLEPEAAPVADASELDRLHMENNKLRALNRACDEVIVAQSAENAKLRAKIEAHERLLKNQELTIAELTGSSAGNKTCQVLLEDAVESEAALRAINAELVGVVKDAMGKGDLIVDVLKGREYLDIFAAHWAAFLDRANAALAKAEAMKGEK